MAFTDGIFVREYFLTLHKFSSTIILENVPILRIIQFAIFRDIRWQKLDLKLFQVTN